MTHKTELSVSLPCETAPASGGRFDSIILGYETGTITTRDGARYGITISGACLNVYPLEGSKGESRVDLTPLFSAMLAQIAAPVAAVEPRGILDSVQDQYEADKRLPDCGNALTGGQGFTESSDAAESVLIASAGDSSARYALESLYNGGAYRMTYDSRFGAFEIIRTLERGVEMFEQFTGRSEDDSDVLRVLSLVWFDYESEAQPRESSDV